MGAKLLRHHTRLKGRVDGPHIIFPHPLHGVSELEGGRFITVHDQHTYLSGRQTRRGHVVEPHEASEFLDGNSAVFAPRDAIPLELATVEPF